MKLIDLFHILCRHEGGVTVTTYEERVDIGRRVYTHEMSISEAIEIYHLSGSTVGFYVSLYKKEVGISKPRNRRTYEELHEEELRKELIKKDIEIERLKKGYAVKGVGVEKEFVTISDVNMK